MELAQLQLELFPELGVQRTQGLIQQQHFRLVDDGPCEGHPLPLSAGKLVGVAAGERGDLGQLQHRGGAAHNVVGGQPFHAQSERDVLGDAEVRKERVGLEDRVDRPLPRWQTQGIHPADPHRTAVREIQTGNDSEQGGLAAA